MHTLGLVSPTLNALCCGVSTAGTTPGGDEDDGDDDAIAAAAENSNTRVHTHNTHTRTMQMHAPNTLNGGEQTFEVHFHQRDVAVQGFQKCVRAFGSNAAVCTGGGGEVDWVGRTTIDKTAKETRTWFGWSAWGGY